MPDQTKSASSADEMKEAARLSQEAGIADESAAYETASENGEPTKADNVDEPDEKNG